MADSGYPVDPPGLKVARNILNDAFDPVPFMTKLPQNLPDQFGRVILVGTTRPLLVTSAPRILVECWAKTPQAAEDFAGHAVQVLRNAQGSFATETFVRGFDNIEGPADNPDPQVDWLERWQFQGDLLLSTSRLATGSS